MREAPPFRPQRPDGLSAVAKPYSANYDPNYKLRVPLRIGRLCALRAEHAICRRQPIHNRQRRRRRRRPRPAPLLEYQSQPELAPNTQLQREGDA
jgi:hypothetical protein